MARLTKWDEEKKQYTIDPAIEKTIINTLGKYEDGKIPMEITFPGYGAFIIYRNDEPGCPGLTVTFRPESIEGEKEIAYIRGITASEKDAEQGDIAVLAYGDPYDENPTNKTIISLDGIRTAIKEADPLHEYKK